MCLVNYTSLSLSLNGTQSDMEHNMTFLCRASCFAPQMEIYLVVVQGIEHCRDIHSFQRLNPDNFAFALSLHLAPLLVYLEFLVKDLFGWIPLNMTCSLGSHLLLSSDQNLHIVSWSNFILMCFRCRSSPAEWHQSCWGFHWLCWSGAHRISGGQTRKLHTEKNTSEPWTNMLPDIS